MFTTILLKIFHFQGILAAAFPSSFLGNNCRRGGIRAAECLDLGRVYSPDPRVLLAPRPALATSFQHHPPTKASASLKGPRNL